MAPAADSWRSPSAVKSPCTSTFTSRAFSFLSAAKLPPLSSALPPSRLAVTFCRTNPFSSNATLPRLFPSKGDPGERRMSLSCRFTAPLTVATSMCMMGNPSVKEISAIPVAVVWVRLLRRMSDKGDCLVSCKACSRGPRMSAAIPTAKWWPKSGICAERLLTTMPGAVLKRAVASSTDSEDLSITSIPLRPVSAGQGLSETFCR